MGNGRAKEGFSTTVKISLGSQPWPVFLDCSSEPQNIHVIKWLNQYQNRDNSSLFPSRRNKQLLDQAVSKEILASLLEKAGLSLDSEIRRDMSSHRSEGKEDYCQNFSLFNDIFTLSHQSSWKLKGAWATFIFRVAKLKTLLLKTTRSQESWTRPPSTRSLKLRQP